MSAPTRRGFLSAIAIAPVVIAAPAAAFSGTDRHGAWLAERALLLAYANSVDCESKAFDDACLAMGSIERRIMHTPAANIAEAKAKLRFATVLDAEGSQLAGDDAAEIMVDIAPFLA
ncbi:hypothetical protein [Sphingomonas aquatilis]